MSKIVATKNESLKSWILTNGPLTYFGPIGKAGEPIKWRACYNPKRVIEKLEAINAGTETAEIKAKKVTEAFQSMTQPVKVLPFAVQFGEAPVETATPTDEQVESAEQAAATEEAPHSPAVKGKFPSKKTAAV